MHFSDLVLAIDVDAVAKVHGDDALGGLWNVFTKCKDSLKDGPRLENIAWRLWHREVFSVHESHRVESETDKHLLLSPDVHQPRAISPIDHLSSTSDCDNETLVDTPQPSPLEPDPAASNVLHLARRSATRSSSPSASGSAARSSSQPCTSSSAISTSRTILDSHHRTSSAPNRLGDDNADTKSHSPGRSNVNIGQIISSLLPDKVDLPRSPRHPAAVVNGPIANVLHPSTPYYLSPQDRHSDGHGIYGTMQAPHLVADRHDSAARRATDSLPRVPDPPMLLPSSISSASSSSSSASSFAGPSTPPSPSGFSSLVTGNSAYGPRELESHSGTVTPRGVPTSPIRTRSPANSTPRASVPNGQPNTQSSLQYSSSPAVPPSSHQLNGNTNRLSIARRSSITSTPLPPAALAPTQQQQQSPRLLNSDPNHNPTVILTHPTPRPTPTPTPTQPLSPSDTPVASPTATFSPPPRLARTATTGQLSIYPRGQQQRRATPHLLAVPFVLPPSHSDDEDEQERRQQQRAAPSPYQAYHRSLGNAASSSSRETSSDRSSATSSSSRAHPADGSRRPHPKLLASPFSQPIDEDRPSAPMMVSTSSSRASSGSGHAAALGKGVHAANNGDPENLTAGVAGYVGDLMNLPPASAAMPGAGSGTSSAQRQGAGAGELPALQPHVAQAQEEAAQRAAAARKIFFIQRSPPGEERFVDEGSSASSGALSASYMDASLSGRDASSSRSPVDPVDVAPPAKGAESVLASENAQSKPVAVSTSSGESPKTMSQLRHSTSSGIVVSTEVAPSGGHSPTSGARESAEKHSADVRVDAVGASTRSKSDATLPATTTQPHTDDGSRRLTPGAKGKQKQVVILDAPSSPPVGRERAVSSSLPHERPASPDVAPADAEISTQTRPADSGADETATTTTMPLIPVEKKTVRLPKSHSGTSLHRKGARSVAFPPLSRLAKHHDKPLAVDKRPAASAVPAARPKVVRRTSNGSSTHAAKTSTAKFTVAPLTEASASSSKRKGKSSAAHAGSGRRSSTETDSTLSSSLQSQSQSFSHSRSPGSTSGAHRAFVSSPLSAASISAAAPITTVVEEPVAPPVPPPIEQVKPAMSNGALKRPPMPGRAHTSAGVIRTTEAKASTSKAAHTSKSPGKRSVHRPSPARHEPAATSSATGGRKRPVVDMTSSDFETTSEEGSSIWSEEEDLAPPPPKNANANAAGGKGKGRASASQERKETGTLGLAAAEVARQRDMFRKVPSRSYSNLGLKRQTGLLTPLLNPDPRLVPYLPANAQAAISNGAGQLGRPHNSAQNLGRLRPLAPMNALQPMTTAAAPAVQTQMAPPSSKSMLKPSKSAAEVRVAPVSVTTQVAVNPSGRAGYRLKGKPEGEEVESDDEDEENPLDVDGMSKSVAQRRLEQLAGLGKKQQQQQHHQPGQQHSAVPQRKPDSREPQQHRQPYPSPETSFTPHQPDDFYNYQSAELTRTPSMPLPHPYNLPAPAPPQSPRTTRRQMMANEMSESLRRNLLWERTLTRRMLGGFTRITPVTPIVPPTNGRVDEQVSRTSVQPRGPPAPLSRTKSWADDYHASGW